MKLVCRECDWQGDDSTVLWAPNPFRPEWKIAGCPLCSQVEQFDEACDEPDCWQATCCGTPTQTGYRRTCSKHVPREHDGLALAADPRSVGPDREE